MLFGRLLNNLEAELFDNDKLRIESYLRQRFGVLWDTSHQKEKEKDKGTTFLALPSSLGERESR